MSTLSVVLAVVGGFVVLWLLLVGTLWIAARRQSRGSDLRGMVRLVPDIIRLVTRLARDSSLPGGVRLRLALLLGYLALPIDLVPDVVPVLGYADDVVVAAVRDVDMEDLVSESGTCDTVSLPPRQSSKRARAFVRKPSPLASQVHTVL